METTSSPKAHRRITIKPIEQHETQHAKQTEPSLKSKKGKQTSHTVKLETDMHTPPKSRISTRSSTMEETIKPKQSKHKRTRGREEEEEEEEDLSEGYSTTNKSNNTIKTDKSNKRMGKLSENLLNSIDMTGTLRSEWKIVNRNDSRISLTVTSSPLCEFEDMRSVLSRLM